MSTRKRFALLCGAMGVLAFVLFIVVAKISHGTEPGEAAGFGMLAGMMVAAGLGLVWRHHDRGTLAPLAQVGLLDIPVNAMFTRGREHNPTAQQQWLEAILIDLAEGVVTCSPDHRILLTNQAAIRLLNGREAVGLGRPLSGIVDVGPIEAALAGLGSSPAEIETRTADGRPLHARLARVAVADGPAPYVLTFAAPGAEADERPAARPEFYDFDLIRAHSDAGSSGGRLLSALTFVVFDTETTGLKPSGGDRIVSIGAVRVVNGRVIGRETFERLVDPDRPIPAASVRFHGITDGMVAGKPKLAEVLPQFKAFIGDAVLVAHNVAFDLKFLQMAEPETGIAIANPVLDTQMLAALLDAEGDHSLDAVAHHLGIAVEGRHSALADSLLTAEVLVRLIDLLAARGIRTYDDAATASNLAAEIQKRQRWF